MTRNRKIILIIVLAVSMPVVTIYLRERVNSLRQPLHGVVSDESIMTGSVKLYHWNAWANLGPGNDSHVNDIYRLGSGQAIRALHHDTLLTACLQHDRWCAHSPSWRPYRQFVSPNGLHYELGDLNKSEKQLYSSITTNTTTQCMAYNTTGMTGIKFYEQRPNYELLCVTPALNLLLYEYISDQDSVTI